MRQLPVQLPPPPGNNSGRRGGPWREAVFFLIAFVAVFGAAMLGLDVIARLMA